MSPRPIILTLSRKRRRLYFQALMVVFILAVPMLFLYATGYRFETLTLLTKTGGIYVGTEQADANIYLNHELVRETGTFRRAFFIQDLKPGSYTISVSKPGYFSWEKTLPVYEHIVTEARAFTLPKEPVRELIPSTFVNQTTDATSTTAIPNPIYTAIVARFGTTSTTTKKQKRPTHSTTRSVIAIVTEGIATTTKVFGGMQLYSEREQVIARWMRTAENAPFYFCIRESECVESIALNTKGEKPASFDFFPGTTDLAILTLKDGVYVTELDNRSEQNIQPLYLSAGADFRLIDGSIYVKTADNSVYKVEI
jgi:PEGA domain